MYNPTRDRINKCLQVTSSITMCISSKKKNTSRHYSLFSKQIRIDEFKDLFSRNKILSTLSKLYF